MKVSPVDLFEYFTIPNILKKEDPKKYQAIDKYMEDEENQIKYSYGMVDFEKPRLIVLKGGKKEKELPLDKQMSSGSYKYEKGNIRLVAGGGNEESNKKSSYTIDLDENALTLYDSFEQEFEMNIREDKDLFRRINENPGDYSLIVE